MKISDALAALALSSGTVGSAEFLLTDSITSGLTATVGTDATSHHGSASIAGFPSIGSEQSTQASEEETCPVADKPQLLDNQRVFDQTGQNVCPLVCTQDEGVWPNGIRYRVTQHNVPDLNCVRDMLKNAEATSQPQGGRDWLFWTRIAALFISDCILLPGLVVFLGVEMYLLVEDRVIRFTPGYGLCLCPECTNQRRMART